MGPKKREKESAMNDVAAVNSNKTVVIGSKIDSVQADHELFLQAFESNSVLLYFYESNSTKL